MTSPAVVSPGPFGLGPYLKFIAPAVVTVIGAIVDGLVANKWDMLQMEILVVGLLSATVSFVVTNGPSGILRYAKALAPAVLTLIAIGAHYLFTGEWNNIETAGAVTGLLTAFVTLLVPNNGVVRPVVVPKA